MDPMPTPRSTGKGNGELQDTPSSGLRSPEASAAGCWAEGPRLPSRAVRRASGRRRSGSPSRKVSRRTGSRQPTARQRAGRTALDPHEQHQALEVEAKADSGDDGRPAAPALVHRPCRCASSHNPGGAKPLEIAVLLAVDRRCDEGGRRRLRVRPGGCRDVAHKELVWNRRAQQPVDVSQMPSEQVVEFRVVIRGVVVAVPPEPVASLGDQNLLGGPGQGAAGSALWPCAA